MDEVFASEIAKAARKKKREEKTAQKMKEKSKKTKTTKAAKTSSAGEKPKREVTARKTKTKETSKKKAAKPGTMGEKRKREVAARKEKAAQVAALPSWTCGYCEQGAIPGGVVEGCDGCDGWFHDSCLKNATKSSVPMPPSIAVSARESTQAAGPGGSGNNSEAEEFHMVVSTVFRKVHKGMEARVPQQTCNNICYFSIPSNDILGQQVRGTVASNAEQLSRHRGKQVEVGVEAEAVQK
jgi:hypothetical protein